MNQQSNIFQSEIFIIELDDYHLPVIGQALHLLMASTDSEVRAKDALETLSLQVSGIFLNPLKHRVYIGDITAPAKARYNNKTMYLPYK